MPRPSRTQYRTIATPVAALAISALLAACQSGGSRGGSGGRSSTPLAPSPSGSGLAYPSPAQAAASGKTVMLVGDRAVGWTEITPMLAEAAGGQIVEEYALGVALQNECQRRGLRVTEDMVTSERHLMATQLARSAGVPASESETLIANVRRSRGLGDHRFRALLERNAALRALVRTDPEGPVLVSAEDIETAYQLKHGPRVKARLILVRSSQTAAQAAQRVSAGANSGAVFAEVAADTSLDPSAARGGMLDAFSLSDANYPVAIRRTLGDMQPGQVSDPIAVSWAGEQGYAIVRLEETIAVASPPKDTVTSELEQEVRTVRERARMDVLARQLLTTSGVSVMDRSLGWSWENRQGQPGQ